MPQENLDARGGRGAHLIGFDQGKSMTLPVFKSDRVYSSSEQENVQIFWAGMRTNVGVYTLNNFSFNSTTVGEHIILN